MICCVTGHRPVGLWFTYGNQEDVLFKDYQFRLRKAVEQLILEGYTHFISGMAQGVDLDFAELVIEYKEKLQLPLVLEAAIPFPNQTRGWTLDFLGRYERVRSLCDLESVICEHYHRGCMQMRNRYMVDRSDLVLAVWNGERKGGTWNTVQYAQRLGKPVRVIER